MSALGSPGRWRGLRSVLALASLAACNQDAHPILVPGRPRADSAIPVEQDASVEAGEPSPEPGEPQDAGPSPEADSGPTPVDPRPPPDPPPAEAAQPPVRAELIVPPNLAALAPTDRDLTVAFIGDQGLSSASRAVLALIKEEGAQAVVHNGDFDYASDPAAWDTLINEVLGEDFPYFSTIGNHDAPVFHGKLQPDGSVGPGCEMYAP